VLQVPRVLSQTSSSRLHIHELLSLPATKALVSDLLYKVLLEARIRYAYATHTLRIRYAYATYMLRIRYAYLTCEALGSDLRYKMLLEARICYAYATEALVLDLARSAVCRRVCAYATHTLRIRY
jgi:hypothetical protein